MTTRAPGSDRTREGLNGPIQGRLGVENARSELLRQAARLIIEEGLIATPWAGAATSAAWSRAWAIATACATDI